MSEPSKEELWTMLTDTARALPMYKNHKRFVEEVMLKEKPDISPAELAIQINVTLGEAVVILHEIKSKSQAGRIQSSSPQAKPHEKTLFEFTAK